jgi:hypothetical protein
LHNRGMLRRGIWRRCGLGILVPACLLACVSSARAAAKKPSDVLTRPVLRIPVDALGFTPPPALYLPYRIPESSLDFLDADHLLLTFHVARLMRRRPDASESDQDQTIHAVLFDLPGGRIAAQTDWRLHDRARYLWMLGGGTFLLRKGDTFYRGDTSLELRPYLSPVGSFMFAELSPDAAHFEVEYSNPATEDAPATKSQAPSLLGDGTQFAKPKQKYTLLIVDTQNLTSKRVNDLPAPIMLPLVPGGYLTAVEGKGRQWAVMMNPWQGAPHAITTVDSTCRPDAQPISSDAFLALSCLPYSTDHLVQAFDLSGKKLWEQRWQSRFIWGTFSYSRSGSRFAYGSLEVDHDVDPLDPVDISSILGQPVGVFEVQNGKSDLVLGATPIITAGENFALSPSGDRFAIVRDGAIELYDLPPIAGTAPAPPAAKAKR